MKVPLLLVAAWFAAALPLGAADDAAVRVPLDQYIQAHATGDPNFIRQAFHQDAKVLSVKDGKISVLTREEFALRFNGKPADDEAQRRRSIEAVDVSGTAASARIRLDYPHVTFTDYMQLLNVGGEWKIVSKAFHAAPKTTAK